MAEAGYDWVTFLSDYGHDDVFVGVCKGVIAGVAPHTRIIDICHLIAPQDVEAGAHALNAADHRLRRKLVPPWQDTRPGEASPTSRSLPSRRLRRPCACPR